MHHVYHGGVSLPEVGRQKQSYPCGSSTSGTTARARATSVTSMSMSTIGLAAKPTTAVLP